MLRGAIQDASRRRSIRLPVPRRGGRRGLLHRTGARRRSRETTSARIMAFLSVAVPHHGVLVHREPGVRSASQTGRPKPSLVLDYVWRNSSADVVGLDERLSSGRTSRSAAASWLSSRSRSVHYSRGLTNLSRRSATGRSLSCKPARPCRPAGARVRCTTMFESIALALGCCCSPLMCCERERTILP